MRLHRHFSANEELLEPFPFKRELSMESYLVENENVLSLDQDIYSDVTIVQDELTLKQGRSSNDTDGRIDVLATYSNEHIAVIELKLGELSQIHLEQLEDYLLEKHQILEQFPDIIDRAITPVPKWIGVLVGSSIEPELANTINNGYTTQDGVPIAALTIQRFRGANGGVYVVTDLFFKNISPTKDTTKYVFEGQSFGKGRLALALVKRYVEDHPNVTYAELGRIFPRNLQGSNGVFTTLDNAENVYANTSYCRHFIKPEEVIMLSDTEIAISNQWGIGNISNLIERATKLGYQVN